MTTTRFYFTDAAPGVTVARAAAWIAGGSPLLKTLTSTRPSSGTLAGNSVSENTTPVQSILNWQGIGSNTLPAGAVSGTYALSFSVSENTSLADTFLRVIGRVVSADGATVRGTILDVTESLESATAGATRYVTGALAAQTAQAGDRLVFEVGGHFANVTTLAASFNVNGGNWSSADLAASDGSTTAGIPWIDLVLDDPPNPPTSVTQTGATTTGVTVGWTAPATGTAPTSYEYRVNGGTPVNVGLVTSTTIGSLTPGTTYTVEVRSLNAIGSSSWASGSATTDPPPSVPTGLAQTAATPVSVTVGWTAPVTGATPTSYEYRVGGGSPVDVGNVLTATISGLAPVTTYTVEVRTLSTGAGASSWASVDATTAEVSGDGLALEAGTTFGTQLLDDAYSITIRRGQRPNGVTDDLDPATFTAVIKGSGAVNPLTNDDVRPERPIRLRGTLDGGATWDTVWTGKILRSRIEYDPDKKDDAEAYRLILTGTDVVATLAGIPSDVAIDGNLHQRVGAVLDPTGLAYVVDDPGSVGAGAPLATDAKDVLGQLRLIRDTEHALMFVARNGALVAVADSARPRTIASADWTATDDHTVTDAIHYTHIDPAFDTDAVVNILTVTTLDGADNPVAVFTDETSRAGWGDKPRAITVNDGVAETHADLYLASRVDPDLVPEHIEFVVQERLPQAIDPTVHSAHRTAAIGAELYDVVRVERDGMPTTDLLIREITHTISHLAWRVGFGLRVPEVLATRWDDVPVGLTWDDVPPGMTWREAVNWHPYL